MIGKTLTAAQTRRIQKAVATVPYAHLLGIELDDVGEGVATLGLKVRKELKQNRGALHGGAIASLIDTAMAFGVSYGAATAVKGTWEFGVIQQTIEKDSLFGQMVDSDFGDGNTDADGFVIRGGYTVARNWTVNATLFLNELSNDVPQSVTVFNEATPALYDTSVITGINDREYKRLQLDLNFRF